MFIAPEIFQRKVNNSIPINVDVFVVVVETVLDEFQVQPEYCPCLVES